MVYWLLGMRTARQEGVFSNPTQNTMLFFLDVGQHCTKIVYKPVFYSHSVYACLKHVIVPLHFICSNVHVSI